MHFIIIEKFIISFLNSNQKKHIEIFNIYIYYINNHINEINIIKHHFTKSTLYINNLHFMSLCLFDKISIRKIKKLDMIFTNKLRIILIICGILQ